MRKQLGGGVGYLGLVVDFWRKATLVSITLSVLGPHWNSFRISCCCPMLWRSCNLGSADQDSFTCSNSLYILGWVKSQPWFVAWAKVGLVCLTSPPGGAT